MGLRLLSIAFWGFLGATSILLFPIAILIWLGDRFFRRGYNI